nr:MAG TPA: nucelotide kinase [Caudoviricetes sp.]
MDVRTIHYVEAIANAAVNEGTIFVCTADMHIDGGIQPCLVTPAAGVTITVDSDWEGTTTLDRSALDATGAHDENVGGGTIVWEWVEGTDRDRHVMWTKAHKPTSGTVILRGYPKHVTPVNAIFGEGVLVIHEPTHKAAPLTATTYWEDGTKTVEELLEPATITALPIDDVKSPSHYTWLGDAIVREGGPQDTDMIESWDVLDALFPDDPLLWNATKYLTRYGRKGSSNRRIVDLRKAVEYIERRIAKLEHDA